MRCRVLTQEQVARIHETSLAILERVGVHVPHADVLARFAQAGADVDRAAGAVGIEERCRQRKEEILATHRPQPIADDLARALDAIVASARRHLAGR